MARMLNWDTSEVIAMCTEGGMERLEAAAEIIRDDAKRILSGKVKDDWKEHGPYKTGYSKKQGKWIKGSGIWTERKHGAMVKTIRVVRRDDKRNVWIMAGNYKTWWAVQMEYGHGEWKGGAKPFLRPALAAAPARVRTVIEGGAAPSVVI